MVINFKVSGQSLRRLTYDTVVENSKNYLFCHFDFIGSEWSSLTKIAMFTHKKLNISIPMLLDEYDSCEVPGVVLRAGELDISVYGGDLITSSVCTVDILRSGILEGDEPVEVPKSLYSQLINEFDKTKTEFAAYCDNVKKEIAVLCREETNKELSNVNNRCFALENNVSYLTEKCTALETAVKDISEFIGDYIIEPVIEGITDKLVLKTEFAAAKYCVYAGDTALSEIRSTDVPTVSATGAFNGSNITLRLYSDDGTFMSAYKLVTYNIYGKNIGKLTEVTV